MFSDFPVSSRYTPPTPEDDWADDDGTILQPIQQYDVIQSRDHPSQSRGHPSQSRDHPGQSRRASGGTVESRNATVKPRDATIKPRDGTIKSRDGTLVASGAESRDVSLNDVTLRRASDHDDRPITPMRNTMIYNKDHSSLDFEDGEFSFHCVSIFFPIFMSFLRNDLISQERNGRSSSFLLVLSSS